jgi:hypothetical protein
MTRRRRNILLVQLPIPPLGPQPIRGNVPLAAAYLKLFAEKKGLGESFAIDILPASLANDRGDQALVAEILARDPWLVGFTCYVWNIERTMWIAHRLRQQRPDLRIVLGGPEITSDNHWVLQEGTYDFAVIGEGEQTFTEVLASLAADRVPIAVPGLYHAGSGIAPAFRTPMADLNQLGSPYLAGILDAADEQMLLLETTRGCIFKCKFCYYPKSYDGLYFLGRETILANLRHAAERGAREVFLLDPTLNQRKDFGALLQTLTEGNPDRAFSYFGELRGEGITPQTAALLRQANFIEVEVGLQSIDRDAMHLMDRNNNLKAFERGVRAMAAEGIKVKVDLIIGLPGDTVESVRAGLHYLKDRGLDDDVQVFNLSILPGTDFRKEAAALGLKHQPRPPYYVLQTPTLSRGDLFQLMQEAQELFEIEFDAMPPPMLDFTHADSARRLLRHDFDNPPEVSFSPGQQAQAFTLCLRAADLDAHRYPAAAMIERILGENPFTTLQVVLEPGKAMSVSPRLLEMLTTACQSRPTYLDKFYALQPGRPNGAKRLIVLLPAPLRAQLDPDWLDEVGGSATIAWRGAAEPFADELEPYEFAV